MNADGLSNGSGWAGLAHPLVEPLHQSGRGRVYGNSHLTIAGASTNRMIAMKLHAGRPPDLADLDILLKEAGVETRREAAGLHELTYGTEPMAAEADLYLIKRYRRRRDWDTGPTR